MRLIKMRLDCRVIQRTAIEYGIFREEYRLGGHEVERTIEKISSSVSKMIEFGKNY